MQLTKRELVDRITRAVKRGVLEYDDPPIVEKAFNDILRDFKGMLVTEAVRKWIDKYV